MSATPLPADEAARLERRGLRLEYATIGWNAVEVVVTIGLGIAARSLALVAFGLDTVVELFASSVVVWHLRGDTGHAPRSVRAVRLVAFSFLALAALLAAAAVWALVAGHRADESPLGIAYLAATAVVMLTLALLKRATGRRLGSEPLVSESTVTLLDAALASGVLLALALNAVLGWWWADGAAGLLVAAAALREGLEGRAEAAEMSAEIATEGR